MNRGVIINLMPLLFQSILLVGITCYLLSTLLFVLTKDMPKVRKGISWWALASVAGAAGYFALLVCGNMGIPAQGEALYNLSLISWSSFLLIGSSQWLKKDINIRLILGISSLSTIWVMYFSFIQPVFLPAAIATAVTCGALTLYTGWLFLSSEKTKGSETKALIIVLFISGLHALDYPILRPHESFAMVGIIVCIIASLAINIILASIVIIQFKKSMKNSEKHAINMAMQDPLTGLKNRLGLIEEFNKKVDLAPHGQQRIALIFADLDNFKTINDTYGHEDGDQVLCTIAERIQSLIRHNDVAVRIGGDEFVILLSDIKPNDWEHIPRFISRLIKETCEPITIKKYTHQVGASIGLAVYPKDGEHLQDLLNCADSSMYLDKRMKKQTTKKQIPLSIANSAPAVPAEDAELRNTQ
ncbi:MAG: Unknown protein [uncultured Thiotrichaceae bacterium]|uniref:GGDEF domain-containing protein n=1 Tax=uncultured Thiotrichaceae bacterium TaxID=298394 RepID=A0A6S6SBS4_9GAMM|nr:MAG: Unknown protein [uncultured Thiotrichaceae bacterium]